MFPKVLWASTEKVHTNTLESGRLFGKGAVA